MYQDNLLYQKGSMNNRGSITIQSVAASTLFLFGLGVAISRVTVLSSLIQESAMAANAGAIWTTTGSCGAPQNVNHYGIGDVVFINGDGFEANMSRDWTIKGNSNGSKCDPDTVVASNIPQITTDSNGAFCIQAYIIPDNDCGEYTVDVTGASKNDNYRVRGGTEPEPTLSPTPSSSPATTPSPLPSPTPSPTPSVTPEPSPSVSPSPTPSVSPTPSSSPATTPSPSPSATPTGSPTPEPSPSAVPSPTPTPVASPTPTPSPSPTPTATPLVNPSPTPTSSPSSNSNNDNSNTNGEVLGTSTTSSSTSNNSASTTTSRTSSGQVLGATTETSSTKIARGGRVLGATTDSKNASSSGKRGQVLGASTEYAEAGIVEDMIMNAIGAAGGMITMGGSLWWARRQQ